MILPHIQKNVLIGFSIFVALIIVLAGIQFYAPSVLTGVISKAPNASTGLVSCSAGSLIATIDPASPRSVSFTMSPTFTPTVSTLPPLNWKVRPGDISNASHDITQSNDSSPYIATYQYPSDGTFLASVVSAAAPSIRYLSGNTTECKVEVRIGESGEVTGASGIPYGWDYNLTKQCVTSLSASDPYYFSDTTGCQNDGKHWLTAVQAERTLAASCQAVNNQSLPINADAGVSLNWFPHVDGQQRASKRVEMKTDYINTAHPCGARVFTWHTLMDGVSSGGGPLPEPMKSLLSVRLTYRPQIVDGGTRAVIGWTGFWDGKAHMIDMDVARTNYGDNDPDPLVISTSDTNGVEYANIDGAYFGYSLQDNIPTTLSIDWNRVVQVLIDRGFFRAPSGTYAPVLGQMSVATEVYNATVSNAAALTLDVTNFRIEEKQ